MLLWFTPMAVLFFGAVILAASGAPMTVITADQFRDLVSRGETYHAIEQVSKADEPLTVAERYDALMRSLYSEHKDLRTAIVAGRAGILFCLSQAQRNTDPEIAQQLRGQAKTMAYNIGSYAWKGWDEPGIIITAAEEREGWEAAILNLKLAQELNRGPGPLSAAHWLVGAHHLVRAEYSKAIDRFTAAADLSASAKQPTESLMNRGYIALAQSLAEPADAQEQALISALNELRRAHPEDGPFFADQIQAARKALAR